MEFPGFHLPQETKAQRQAYGAAFQEWVAAERARVSQQRLFLSRIGGCARDELVRLMLERAWCLLDAGEAEAADALLEFCPSEMAEALLNDFFEGPTG